MARRKRIPYDPPHLRAGKKGRRSAIASRADELFVSRRMLIAKTGIAAAFVALAGRLGYLQLARADELKTASAAYVRRQETVPATRGLILDRRGRELAVNQQTWEVRLRPSDLPDADTPERRLVLDQVINALSLPDALVLDPKGVPAGSENVIYARSAELLGKVLSVEATGQAVQYPFFRVPGKVVRVNGYDLVLHFYPDVTSRKSDSARISSDRRLVAGVEAGWGADTSVFYWGNVLGVLTSPDPRVANRVQRAIESLPKDAVSTEDEAISTLRDNALRAWTSYIESEQAINYLVRLEDELTTDQAALLRAHLPDLPGVIVMNQLEYLIENGRDRQQIVVKTGVPRETALKLEANRLNLPGVEVDGGALIRRYQGGEAMSHLLGYVGKISSSELIANTDEGADIPTYEQDDYIGKDGLELVLEEQLKGRRGKQVVELDSSGNRWRVSPNARIAPVPGNNVQLSVDLEFQRAVAEILRGGIQFSNDDRSYIQKLDPNRKVKKFSGAGAVVALDPRTGEVLAMVSYPLYDNQLFVDGISERKYREYVSEEANKPLIDRALRGEYPPGSTLKPFIAAAGLQEKVISPDKTYTCTGAIKVPWAWDQSKGNSHPCWIWRNGGHEALDVYGAIERSCDVYFYNVGAPRQPLDEAKTDYLHYRDEFLLLPPEQQLGEKHYFDGLGIKLIKKNLTEGFQFGIPTGIDLPAEAPGVAPDDEWLARTYQGAGWSLGDTINVSIGQGYFLTTPLQLTLNTAAIANGGKLMKPLLVKDITPTDGSPGEQREPEIVREVGIQREFIDIVREGMRRVVHADFGTARLNADGSSKWAKTNPTDGDVPVEEIIIGGKTGTAELGVPDENGIYERQHSWFTCFAPFDDPEIAISVIIEDGGEGSAYAVPVADRVLRAWFEINGRRDRGLVLRTDADLTRPDEQLLAPGAAFPTPGSFATPGVQVQD